MLRPSEVPALTAFDPLQAVVRFAPYLRVVHQISGRVRLKLDAAALVDRTLPGIGAEWLRRALGEIRGVRNLQFNLLARSCVVEYDSGTIPDAAWADLLAGRQTPAADALVAILKERCEEIRHGQP
jgi:hypothetical protein